MTERLLQFIWQFQYFNTSALVTEQGEQLHVIHQGNHNTDQGPDFLNGKLLISGTTWIGNIELHIKSSDWHTHGHTNDSNYSNIILHVVWEHDAEVTDAHGAVLPTLCLGSRVPRVLLARYEGLMFSPGFVASQPHLPAIAPLAWVAWKERLVVERLQRKASGVINLLKAANNHWEEVFWWMLARSFGAKVNTEIFESMARSIPVNILGRHKNQIHQLEGLLLGQAGLLNDKLEGDYQQLLQREYRFLKNKYQLQPTTKKPFFLRMRPANFPTLRLAQLAMIIHQSLHLFAQIREAETLSQVCKLLEVTPNDFWHYHYTIDDGQDYRHKPIGKQMIQNIIINGIIPVLFAYGSHTKEESYKLKAVAWLAELPPEQNEVVKKWAQNGVSNANALESQALIELKNMYCDPKRCLECAVGTAILKTQRG
ncbi:DUF2851 family protein [Segetibacter sp. 3557_3]|uniref:DUF2851 family protein n=1 Tax=Segetibacter sp. 3557_3 TaxID=2547429 RepID=UPI001058F6EA|nr:DUF2851 family protein [Segetibacter sp. 3557_3]TDH26528.1 DUF2851 family protein [Segetibacter sp. 3557_3]